MKEWQMKQNDLKQWRRNTGDRGTNVRMQEMGWGSRCGWVGTCVFCECNLMISLLVYTTEETTVNMQDSYCYFCMFITHLWMNRWHGHGLQVKNSFVSLHPLHWRGLKRKFLHNKDQFYCASLQTVYIWHWHISFFQSTVRILLHIKHDMDTE